MSRFEKFGFGRGFWQAARSSYRLLLTTFCRPCQKRWFLVINAERRRTECFPSCPVARRIGRRPAYRPPRHGARGGEWVIVAWLTSILNRRPCSLQAEVTCRGNA